MSIDYDRQKMTAFHSNNGLELWMMVKERRLEIQSSRNGWIQREICSGTGMQNSNGEQLIKFLPVKLEGH